MDYNKTERKNEQEKRVLKQIVLIRCIFFITLHHTVCGCLSLFDDESLIAGKKSLSIMNLFELFFLACYELNVRPTKFKETEMSIISDFDWNMKNFVSAVFEV